MFRKRITLVVVASIAGMALLGFTSGWGGESGGGKKAVGTFILTVTAAGAPSFKELITIHKDGTVSETNTTLHPNSANPFFAFNGSDGFGTWEKFDDGSDSGETIVMKFVKMVFDGTTNAHVGYLVVEATARIDGDVFTNLVSDVNIRLGPDFFSPTGLIPLGPTDAVGRRITVD